MRNLGTKFRIGNLSIRTKLQLCMSLTSVLALLLVLYRKFQHQELVI